MFHVSRRWRLFLLVPVLLLEALAQAPTTTISDTVYQADGTPAQGILLISWPAFTSAGGQAVAPGTTSVTLGAGGSLSVALVPNQGATPANTVYTVVYQLSAMVKTEYWSVPTTSPTNLATVRITLGATSAASQMVTQQYVEAAVAGKANDSAVVHLAGSETITGVKQFSVSPSFPMPVQSTDAANKAYVDSSVQNVGGGGPYVSTAGGTMTGPLTLSGNPVAPNQAANKQYVDSWAAVKADLISGLVPPSELASGTPGAGTCLLGNQTWGACGGGSGSSSINSAQVASPNFNSASPAAQSSFLNCSFQNTGSNVSLECPYGNTAASFALGSLAVLNNQANSYGAGLQDFSLASLKLPAGAGYAPAVSGTIGFDTTANMPVINVNGVTQQIALTTSNTSGQASTALALAASPAQCNGSFATGIQANGNANCSMADVIQLAETAQPSGIANYGIFWFDSTTHTPRVIDNNGQVAQLGLMNAFNSDANTLEEYNGTNPQTLNVYGTRADASDYERMRLAYDTTDGYFFLSAEAAGTGTQRGLGFWMQGGLRWVIDESFDFKPWSDNVKDIGTPTLRPKHLYAGTYADLTGGALVTEIPNQTPTGTTLNKLAKVTGSPATAVIASTSDTNGVIGVVADGAGTTGNAQIARGGQASCVFDGPTTAGDYVQISSTTAGDCHDAGASYPGTGQVLGRVLSSNANAGTYALLIAGSETQAPQQGAVASIFGRSGTITAQAGDYSVGQITGAAPLASPAFTGTPTAPTQATSDNSTKIATTAYVQAQGYGTGSAITGSSSLGGTVVQTGSGAFGVSIAKVKVNAIADSLTGCAKIYDVATNYVALPGQSLEIDLMGDQPCNTPPLPSSFANEVDVTGAAIYHMYGSGQWILPNRTRLFGSAATTNPPVSTKGFVIRACNTSGGDSSGNCPSNFPSSTPLACLSSCAPTGGSAAFDTQIWNAYIDCNYISGCTALMNYYAQENSGGFFLDLMNWGNGGIGLDSGGSSGSMGGNSLYEALNLGNTQSTGATCSNAAIGIRLNSGGCPKFVKGVTVQNAACSTASQPLPNDDIVAACNNGAIEDVHLESYKVAGIDVSGSSITIDTVNASSITGVSGATAVVQIESGATSIALRNVVSTAPNAPINTINDLNNQVIPRTVASRITEYDTDQNAKVTADSSGLNPVNFAGGILPGSIKTAALAAPTAPTVTVQGTAGTTTDAYKVVGLDQNGGVTPASGAGTATTANATLTSGNNNLVTWNAVAGTQSYKVYRTTAGGSPSTTGLIGTVAGDVLQLTDTGLAGDSSTPPSANTTGGAVLAGTSTAPTPASSDNSTKIATTAYVQAQAYAPLLSPTFTGTPAAPTPSTGDSSAKIATTAYVQNQTTGIPWLTVGRAGSVSGVTFSTTANQAELWGVVLPFPVTTTQVTYYVGTADNTANNYDIGIYNSSGTLVVHTGTKAGTVFAPAAGATTLSWAASATLQPGKYYLAVTTNCTASCAALDGDNASAVSFLAKGVVAVSAGGTLNSSLTPPADAWSYSSYTPAWAVR